MLRISNLGCTSADKKISPLFVSIAVHQLVAVFFNDMCRITVSPCIWWLLLNKKAPRPIRTYLPCIYAVNFLGEISSTVQIH